MSEIKVGDQIIKYVFKIDGCLTVAERAESEQTARARLERMWPRSTVEYIREELSHIVEDVRTRLATPLRPEMIKGRAVTKSTPKSTERYHGSVEERMEQALAESFGGVA
jgi:hypothetical protein